MEDENKVEKEEVGCDGGKGRRVRSKDVGHSSTKAVAAHEEEALLFISDPARMYASNESKETQLALGIFAFAISIRLPSRPGDPSLFYPSMPPLTTPVITTSNQLFSTFHRITSKRAFLPPPQSPIAHESVTPSPHTTNSIFTSLPLPSSTEPRAPRTLEKLATGRSGELSRAGLPFWRRGYYSS